MTNQNQNTSIQILTNDPEPVNLIEPVETSSDRYGAAYPITIDPVAQFSQRLQTLDFSGQQRHLDHGHREAALNPCMRWGRKPDARPHGDPERTLCQTRAGSAEPAPV
jgi:hypothetical protein